MINLEKSEIIFGGGSGDDIAEQFACEHEVKMVNQHSIYLGLPTKRLDRAKKKLKEFEEQNSFQAD